MPTQPWPTMRDPRPSERRSTERFPRIASDALTPDELLDGIDACWRAANDLSVGQIYLADNPLLKRPLVLTDIKHMLLGHWGTTPGQNFI